MSPEPQYSEPVQADAERVIGQGAAFKNPQKTGTIEYLFASYEHPDSPLITSIHAVCRGVHGRLWSLTSFETRRHTIFVSVLVDFPFFDQLFLVQQFLLLLIDGHFGTAQQAAHGG